MKKLDLLKIILEPKPEDEKNPARRWAFPISPNVLASFLSRAYTREVLARGGGEIENPEDVMKKIHAVSRWLSNPLRKPFLILYGPNPGTGKSTLARAILRVISEDLPRFQRDVSNVVYDEEKRIRDKMNMEIRAIYPPDLWEERVRWRKAWGRVEADYWGKFEKEHPELYRKICEIKGKAEKVIAPLENKLKRLNVIADDGLNFISADELVSCAEQFGRKRVSDFNSGVLFLDDVGEEARTANHMGNQILPVTELLLERYNRRAVTIITANIGDETLAERYGPRIADRLNEIADKIAFMGQSYRK